MKSTRASPMSHTAFLNCASSSIQLEETSDCWGLTPSPNISIGEIQAESIVSRYPFMRVASLRPSWVIPDRAYASKNDSDSERRKNDLWGWVQEQSTAEAFLLAVTADGWSGHEAFFITAATLSADEPAEELYEKYWKDVPIATGKHLRKGFFDCSKAERLLGWVHRDIPESLA